MSSITIRQPVTVKIVLTENTKRDVIKGMQQAMGQIQAELDQIEFQVKQLMEEATKQGPEAIEMVERRANEERNTRIQKREEIMQQMAQIQQTAIGEELTHGQVETSIEVKVGDSWMNIIQGQEIILTEGIVTEIRRPGETV